MRTAPAYLLWFDFDGTMARTFEKSPNDIGVQEAYRMALSRLFGGAVLPIYDKIGGLMNRAPDQIIDLILAQKPALKLEAMRRISQELPDILALSFERDETTIAEALV